MYQIKIGFVTVIEFWYKEFQHGKYLSAPRPTFASCVISLTLKGLLYSLLKFRHRNIVTNSAYDGQHSNSYLYNINQKYLTSSKMPKCATNDYTTFKGCSHCMEALPKDLITNYIHNACQNIQQIAGLWLTHCSPVMPYGIMLHAHHWLREWLAIYLSPYN